MHEETNGQLKSCLDDPHSCMGSLVDKCGFMEADSPEKGEDLLLLLSTCGQDQNQSCLPC